LWANGLNDDYVLNVLVFYLRTGAAQHIIHICIMQTRIMERQQPILCERVFMVSMFKEKFCTIVMLAVNFAYVVKHLPLI